MRQTSDNGIAKIKQWEGLRTIAYKDGGGVWTIGYGHTSDSNLKVVPGLTITEAKAEELLRIDLREAEQIVNKEVKVPLNVNQFDALVSFVFNVGPGNPKTKAPGFLTSTLLRKLNAGDYDAVPAELARWNKDNGKVVNGLTRRRAAEAALWNKGAFVSSASAPVSTKPAVLSTLAKPEIVMAAIGATGTVSTAASGNGPFAWAVAAVLVVAVVGAVVYFIRKDRRT